MNKHVFESLKNVGKKLLTITEGCRDDLHEPDEQGLSVTVIGNILDNAFRDEINIEFIKLGIQEYIVILKREDFENKIPASIPHNRGFATKNFNLATLIALARIGAKKLLEKEE